MMENLIKKIFSKDDNCVNSYVDKNNSINSNNDCNLSLEGRLGKNKIFNKNQKIKIFQCFDDFDESNEKIWNYLSSYNIIESGDHIDYQDKITGTPLIMKTMDDFIPVKGVFKMEKDNKIFKMDFEKYESSLKLTIESSNDNAPEIYEIMKQGGAIQSKIVLSKDYECDLSIYKAYSFLKENGIVNIKGIDHKLPSISLKEGEIEVPNNMEITTRIDSEKINFKIQSDSFRKRIEVVLNDKLEYVIKVKELLKGFEYKPVKVGKEIIGNSLEDKTNSENDNEFEKDNLIKKYTWDCVGGLGKTKHDLERFIQWPLQNPELFSKMESSMPKGILMMGPPGNGKTTIAKVLANVSGSKFYSVSPADINSKWVGETEKNWKYLFDHARNDVKNGNSVIIFIDEIDGLYINRDEMDKYSRISFGQFCQEIEGISDLEKVIVLGATNRCKDLDPALLRPGRFTKKIYIENPDYEGRLDILKIYTKEKPLDKYINLENLAKKTQDYSGAKLKELCNCASFNAIERYSKSNNLDIKEIIGENINNIQICNLDFEKALLEAKNYDENEHNN